MTSDKAYALEARIAKQVGEGWSIPFDAVKSATEARTSTTLADDADLQFTGVLAGTYMLDLDVVYDGGAGASEGDFKWGFSFPTGSMDLGGAARLTDQNVHLIHYDASTSITVGTNGLNTWLNFNVRGTMIISASGNVVFRWACGTNTGTRSDLAVNSRLALYRRT